MALTERTIIDKYEVVGDFKHIQCRHATVIERDGVEISRSFHRHVISPSDDVTGEPQEVQALVALMHTPEVIAAYEAHVSEDPMKPVKPMKPIKPVKPTWLRSGRVSNV